MIENCIILKIWKVYDVLEVVKDNIVELIFEDIVGMLKVVLERIWLNEIV